MSRLKTDISLGCQKVIRTVQFVGLTNQWKIFNLLGGF